MSQENVEVVRRMFDAFNRRDVDSVIATFDEDCLVQEPREMPDSPSQGFRGHDGIRQDFLVSITLGAEMLARRGASRCIVCGLALKQDSKPLGRRVHRSYCSAHSRAQAGVAKSKQNTIDRTLKHAVRALRSPGC